MHAANLGGFQIMEFSEAADPTVGYAETHTYCVFVEGQDEIRTYDAMWREAHNASLTVAQTIDFIYELSASLEDVT